MKILILIYIAVMSLIAFGAVAASAAYFALTDLIRSEQKNRKDA